MAKKFLDKFRIDSAIATWWDYSSSGTYFVTICTHDRSHSFGEIVNGKMNMSKIGEFAQQYWNEIPKHIPISNPILSGRKGSGTGLFATKMNITGHKNTSSTIPNIGLNIVLMTIVEMMVPIVEVVPKCYFTAKVAKVSQRYAKIKCCNLMLCDPLRN